MLASVWLSMAGGCDQLFALDPVTQIDAFVGPDADTTGWPTDGGVAARDCTGLTGDEDADGKANGCDNCPLDFNGDQADRDRDGVGDICDLHPGYAVERLAYFSGFDRPLVDEGIQVGTSGMYAVEGGQLRQLATTQPRTLFLIAGGPWRSPVVELKIERVTANSNEDYYAGVYLLNVDPPTAPEPRPDALSCVTHLSATPRFRIIRVRDGRDKGGMNDVFTAGTSTTMVCAAERLGEPPSAAAVGTNAAPGALTNWVSIAPDPTDLAMTRIALWTYYARADFSGIAVYDTIWP